MEIKQLLNILHTEKCVEKIIAVRAGGEIQIEPWSEENEPYAIGYGFAKQGGTLTTFEVFVEVAKKERDKGIGTMLLSNLLNRLKERFEPGTELNFFGEYEVETAADHLSEKFGFNISRAEIMFCHKSVIVTSKGIRNVEEKDYVDYWGIWDTSYRAMLMSLGIPVPEEKEIDLSGLREFMDTADDRFVIEMNGKIVAMGDIDGNHIGSLAVAMDEQKKGYGVCLASHMTQQILSRGYHQAELYCEVGNVGAKKTYEKVGFQTEKTIASVSMVIRV